MIKDDIIVMAIKYAIEHKLADMENDHDDGIRLINSAMKRAKILMDNVKFYDIDVYGKTEEEFEIYCKEKRNALFLTDKELREYEVAKKIIDALKEVV